MNEQAKPMLNDVEAAALLGVAPATLNRWRAERIGPAFVRLSGRCVRYRREDVERYIESRRIVTPEAEALERAVS